MLVRRIALAVISLILATIITTLEVTTAWTLFGEQYGLGTTFEEYGQVYTFFTILVIALGFAVVLDKYMKTEILPH